MVFELRRAFNRAFNRRESINCLFCWCSFHSILFQTPVLCVHDTMWCWMHSAHIRQTLYIVLGFQILKFSTVDFSQTLTEGWELACTHVLMIHHMYHDSGEPLPAHKQCRLFCGTSWLHVLVLHCIGALDASGIFFYYYTSEQRTNRIKWTCLWNENILQSNLSIFNSVMMLWRWKMRHCILGRWFYDKYQESLALNVIWRQKS